MKKITLIRHAKSSWKDASLPDIERPLNKRGRRDAPFIGNILHERGMVPDLIISSPARRALMTAHAICDALNYSIESIRLEPIIYHGDVSDHMARIKNFEDSLQHIFWIGHNPSITLLARWLTGQSIENIPTCGVFSSQFEVHTWKSVGEKVGKLEYFDFPKNHSRS